MYEIFTGHSCWLDGDGRYLKTREWTLKKSLKQNKLPIEPGLGLYCMLCFWKGKGSHQGIFSLLVIGKGQPTRKL